MTGEIEMIDINELRSMVNGAQFESFANSVIHSLLDRLEAAESARRDDYQNWMTALDRNAELLAKLEAAEKAVTEAYRRGYATGQEEIAAELEFAKREVADLHDDISEWMDKRDALRAKIETAESDAAHQKALAASALRVAEGWERKCGELRADGATLQQMVYSLKDRIERAEKDLALKERIIDSLGSELNAVANERGAQPAPIEMSITTGALSEMFLSLDGRDKAQPGYEWRKGWNDAIRQAMDYAQPAPSIPEGWIRAIDEALVVAHIGVANESDTYEQAKAKLDNLIGFHVDVATDPAVNGGWKLVPIEPTPKMMRALYTKPFPTDEALLRQALEALEYANDLTKLDGLQGCECRICTNIAALRERLGETK